MIRRLALSTAALAAVLALAPVHAQAPQEQTLGAGVTLAESTTIADLYATPEKFAGRALRIDGTITQVCEEMGCWMALASDANPEQTVRFKVDHGQGIVFPIAARGRKASAQGTLEKIAADDMEGREAAAEQMGEGKMSGFGTTWQIKATGAVIR
ncbi:MAG: DUF4920 domain-containing protein [Vicinamibacterales bacterium]